MEQITVTTIVNIPVEKVWKLWTEPIHIMHWNNASPEWHTTFVKNELNTSNRFCFRMEARDGSFGFDFSGKYDAVDQHKMIAYTLDDGRKVKINFSGEDGKTTINETFEPETQNSHELQQTGWQAILNNFKSYAEKNDKAEFLQFEIHINTSIENVYNKMLAENSYKEWTSEFNPTSYYKGNWEKGSKILFVGTDKNGEEGGMVSRIKENIPNKFISIEHIGILKGDKEIESGKEVDGWAGALENYSFKSANGQTILSVTINVNEEYKSYFIDTWPKALNKLKSICEK